MNKDKNGKVIVVGSTVRLPHKEVATEFEDFVVVAVNRTADKDDVRAVPVKALFACRALNAGQLLVLDDVKEAAPEVAAALPSAGGSQPEIVKLRTDGPTLEKYVKAGYPAEGYPPKGYEAKDSPAYRELLKKREEAAKKAAEQAPQTGGEKNIATTTTTEQIPPA